MKAERACSAADDRLTSALVAACRFKFEEDDGEDDEEDDDAGPAVRSNGCC